MVLPRFARSASAALMFLSLAVPAAFAQGAQPLDAPALPQAQPTPPPKVPSGVAAEASPPKPSSPVVEQIVDDRRPALEVRRRVRVHVVTRHRGWHHRYAGRRLERPALAGVELVEPLPLPAEPPHVSVPLPAYPLEAFAAAYTTPPPPIVCHPARRDPSMPDPRLYKEGAVVCEPDNP